MEFVEPYANVFPEERVIANTITLLRDEELMGGAYARYSPGVTLEHYKLVSEAAVYSEGIPVPALLIRDISAGDLKDTGSGEDGVFRFTIYQCLAGVATNLESADALMREAYRRNRAVYMVLKMKAARAAIFNGVDLGGRAKVFLTRREPGETAGGQASYRRFPSVSVSIPYKEGA